MPKRTYTYDSVETIMEIKFGIISGMKGRKRNPTYELLRIVAMYLIVINHYAMFVPVDFSGHEYNNFFKYFLQTGGKFGVNLFILITGYFMCTAPFRVAKLFSLLARCFTYSVGCYLILSAIANTFSVTEFISSCFPVITNEYWFITAYVGVYLLCPYINHLFHVLDSMQRTKLTILLTVMFSVIPTFTLQATWTSNLVWLAYLYWVGAYIRMDLTEKIKKSRLLLPIGVALFIAIALSCVIIDYASHSIPVLSYNIGHFRNMTSFPLLLSSILIFVWFGNISINGDSKYIPTILMFAKGAFAVCLIHENPYVKSLLWGEWISELSPTGIMYLPFAILFSALVYMLCAVIDVFVSNLLGRINFERLSKWQPIKLNRQG